MTTKQSNDQHICTSTRTQQATRQSRATHCKACGRQRKDPRAAGVYGKCKKGCEERLRYDDTPWEGSAAQHSSGPGVTFVDVGADTSPDRGGVERAHGNIPVPGMLKVLAPRPSGDGSALTPCAEPKLFPECAQHHIAGGGHVAILHRCFVQGVASKNCAVPRRNSDCLERHKICWMRHKVAGEDCGPGLCSIPPLFPRRMDLRLVPPPPGPTAALSPARAKTTTRENSHGCDVCM